MELTLLLADAAAAVGGKVYALGLGWDVTSSPTPPSAIVAIVKVSWDETNQPHHMTLELRDADGHPVTVQTSLGEQGIKIEADFEAGRPPGTPRGTPQSMSVAVGVGPLPLPPGRYEWHAEIDGESRESWTAPFTARPGGAGQR